MRFDIETQASPEKVYRALTDFTPQRLRIWDRTLDPKTYEVREQSRGPTGPSRAKAPPGRRSGSSLATTGPTLPWCAGPWSRAATAEAARASFG